MSVRRRAASRLVTAVLAMTCMATIVATPAAGRQTATTWQMQTVTLPTHGNGQGWQVFANTLRSRTNGEIDLKVHFGAGLGFNPAQMVSLTARRAVDVGELIGSFVEPDLQEANLAAVPGVLPYDVALRKRAAAALAPFYTRILAQKNQVFLGYCQADPRSVMSKKPLRSLADLAGLKIRATGDQEVELTKQLGANPVTGIVSGELYTALQTGVVDAVWGPNSFFFQNKFHEVAKFVLNIDVGGPTNLWTVNQDAWNGISANLRTAVRTAARTGLDACWKGVDVGYRAAAADLKRSGVAIAELTRDEQLKIATLTNALGKQWAASHGPNAPRMYQTVLNVLGSMNVKAALSTRAQFPAPKNVPRAARGYFRGTLTPSETGGTLEWATTFSGLSGPVRRVELRIALAKKFGPLASTLCRQSCTSGKRGTAALLRTAYRAAAQGRAYIVLITARNPSGELRGQLVAQKKG